MLQYPLFVSLPQPSWRQEVFCLIDKFSWLPTCNTNTVTGNQPFDWSQSHGNSSCRSSTPSSCLALCNRSLIIIIFIFISRFHAVLAGLQLFWMWPDLQPGEKSEQGCSGMAKFEDGSFQFDEILIWIVPSWVHGIFVWRRLHSAQCMAKGASTLETEDTTLWLCTRKRLSSQPRFFVHFGLLLSMSTPQPHTPTLPIWRVISGLMTIFP